MFIWSGEGGSTIAKRSLMSDSFNMYISPHTHTHTLESPWQPGPACILVGQHMSSHAQSSSVQWGTGEGCGVCM